MYDFPKAKVNSVGNKIIILRDDVWMIRDVRYDPFHPYHVLCTECMGHLILNHGLKPEHPINTRVMESPCERCDAIKRDWLQYYFGIDYAEVVRLITLSGGKFTRSDGLTVQFKDVLVQSLYSGLKGIM